MSKLVIALILTLAATAGIAQTRVDEWSEVFRSAEGRYQMAIRPGSSLGGEIVFAEARLIRSASGADTPVWTGTLPHVMRPWDALVSEDGKFVATLDDPASSAENLIVVVDDRGRIAHRIGISDLFSADDLEKIVTGRASESSRAWLAEPAFIDEEISAIVIPTIAGYRVIDPRSGTVRRSADRIALLGLDQPKMLKLLADVVEEFHALVENSQGASPTVEEIHGYKLVMYQITGALRETNPRKAGQKAFDRQVSEAIEEATRIHAPRLHARIQETRKRARAAQAEIQMRNLHAALAMFELDFGRKPTTAEGLSILLESVPPYVDKELITDPWGRPFLYESNGLDCRLRSAGPDGQPETADDLQL